MDASGLTVVLGMGERGVTYTEANTQFDTPRDAVFRDTMIRYGVDMGISMLALDPAAGVLAFTSGLVSYLGYRASAPPDRLNELGAVQVLTLTDQYSGIFKEAENDVWSGQSFHVSFQFNYDALAALLSDLRYNLKQPTAYEVDGFQLGAAVAVVNDDRIVAASPGIQMNYWMPPRMEGGFSGLFSSSSNYPYPIGWNGAYDFRAMQRMLGQMSFDEQTTVGEAVRTSRNELIQEIADEEGFSIEIGGGAFEAGDAVRAVDGTVAVSTRLMNLYELGIHLSNRPPPPPRNPNAFSTRFQGTLSRLSQTTAFQRAGRTVGVLQTAITVVQLLDVGAELIDAIAGGGVTTPQRLSGSPHSVGMFDTLVPDTYSLEWYGIDPVLPWQRMLETPRGDEPGMFRPERSPLISFTDPRRAGHRTRSGYSLGTSGDVLAVVSNFEGDRSLSVLDLYVFDEARNIWLPKPAIKEDLMEAIDVIRAGPDTRKTPFAERDEPRDSSPRAPGAHFAGEAVETHILGNDVFMLRKEGGILWFPERLRPDRDTFLDRHVLARNAFYNAIAHRETYASQIAGNPKLPAPQINAPVTEAFRDGIYPIALADWDPSLGGSLAVAREPEGEVPAVAFAIPGANDGDGLLALLSPAFAIYSEDSRQGTGLNQRGYRLEQNDTVLRLPPRHLPGANRGFLTPPYRQPHYAIEVMEVPSSVGSVSGLGRAVAINSSFLVASDAQNRLHLWVYNHRPEVRSFVHSRTFQPDYAMEGDRELAERAVRLAFAGDTLVGVDRMTDGSEAVWAVRIRRESDLFVTVRGDAALFPEEGIPVYIEESGDLTVGRDQFSLEAEEATLRVGLSVPPGAGGIRELEFRLRFSGEDEEGLLGAPSPAFGSGTLRVYQDRAGSLNFLGEAEPIFEDWFVPMGPPIRYVHSSRWRMSARSFHPSRGNLVLRYSPGGGGENSNHREILERIVEGEVNEDSNRVQVAWTRGVINPQNAYFPDQTLKFTVPSDREYLVNTSRSFVSNGPVSRMLYHGSSELVTLDVSGYDGKIYGELVDTNGKALAEVPLATFRDGEIQAQTLTASDGSFVLTGAVPGGQDVITLLDGPFTIVNGENLRPGEVRLVLENTYSFTQQLLRSNGVPVAGMAVRLTNFRTGETRQVRTDENGFYTFTGLWTGLYVVDAVSPIGSHSLGSLLIQRDGNGLQTVPSQFEFTAFPVFEAIVELRNYNSNALIPLSSETFSFSTFVNHRLGEGVFPGDLVFAGGRALLSDLDRRSAWVASLEPESGWFLLPGDVRDITFGRERFDLPSGSFAIEEGLNVIQAVPYRVITGQLVPVAGETWNPQGVRLLLSGEPAGLGEVRDFLATATAGGQFSFRVPEGSYTLQIEGGFLLDDAPAQIVVDAAATPLGALTARLDANIIRGRFFTGVLEKIEVTLTWDGGSMTLDLSLDGRFTSPRLDPRYTYTQWIKTMDGTPFVIQPDGSSPALLPRWDRYRLNPPVPLQPGESYENPAVIARTFTFKTGQPVPWSVLAEDSATGRTVRPPEFYLKTLPGVSPETTWQGAFNTAQQRAGGTLSPSDYLRRFELLNSPDFSFMFAHDTLLSMSVNPPPEWTFPVVPAGSPAGTPVASLSLSGFHGGWTIDSVLTEGGLVSSRFAPAGTSIVMLEDFQGEPPNRRFNLTAIVRLGGIEDTLIEYPFTVRVNALEGPYDLGFPRIAGGRSFLSSGITIDEQVFGDPERLIGHLRPLLELTDPPPVLEILEAGLPFTVSPYGAEVPGSFTLRATRLMDYEEQINYQIPMRVTDANGATFDQTISISLNNLLDPVRATIYDPPILQQEGSERWFTIFVEDLVLEDNVPQELRVNLLVPGSIGTYRNESFGEPELLPRPWLGPGGWEIRIPITDQASGTHTISVQLENRQTGGLSLSNFDNFRELLPRRDLTFAITPVHGQILQPPTRLRRAVGQSLALYAPALSGTPPFSYQWNRDGEPVPGQTDATLYIPSLQASDAGVWHLQVSSPGGSPGLQPMHLHLDLPGDLVVWGPQRLNQTAAVQVPQTLTDVVKAVTSADGIGVALRADGSIASFRAFDNDTAPPFWNATGNANQQVIRDRLEALEVLPEVNRRLVDLAAGSYHFLALTETGDVIAWGENDAGQRSVPADLPPAWSVFANGSVSGALPLSGGIRLWGANTEAFEAEFDERDTLFYDLSFPRAGGLQVLALRYDQTVYAWPASGPAAQDMPADLSPVLQVLQTSFASYALLSEGSLVRWGETTLLPDLPTLPELAAVYSIDGRMMALGRQGQMIAWREVDFGNNYTFLDGYDWTPPDLPAGRSLQSPMDAGLDLRQVGILNVTGPQVANPAPAQIGVPLGGTLRLDPGLRPSVIPYNYFWYSEVDTISIGNPVLVIPNVNASHAGLYELLVTSLHGNLLALSTEVTILYPPVWMSSLAETQSVGQGQSLTLSSPAGGDGLIQYVWRRNGQVLPGQTGSSLEINNATPLSGGTFSVTARSPGGEITRSVFVTVEPPPALRMSAPELEIFPGQRLVLRPQVEGSLPTTYQWFLNDVLIPGATAATLLIENAGTANAGVYRVVATNSVGSAEAEMIVNMREAGFLFGWGPGSELPPALRIPEALRGRADMLSASVSTTHALAVDEAGDVYAWGDNTQGQLNLPTAPGPVMKAVAGEGVSFLLTRTGTVLTTDAAWNPPAGLGPLVDLVAGPDYALALRQNGNVAIWRRNSAPVAPAPTQFGAAIAIAAGQDRAYALYVDGVMRSWSLTDAGDVQEHRAFRSDDHGVQIAAAGDAAAFLTAQGRVSLLGLGELNLSTPSSIKAISQTRGGLLLQLADGSTRWLRNRDAMSMTLPPSLPGMLSLHAGPASVIAVVRADQGPVFLTPPQSLYVEAGSTVNFSQEVVSSETASFLWHLNGVPLPGENALTITLTDVSAPDGGVYTLQATADGFTTESAPARLIVAAENFQALTPAMNIPTLGPVMSLDLDGDLLVGSEQDGVFFITLNEELSFPPFRLSPPDGMSVSRVAANHINWEEGVTPPGNPVALIVDDFGDGFEVSYSRYPANFFNTSAYFPGGGNLQLPDPFMGFAVKDQLAYILTPINLHTVSVHYPTNMGWNFAANLLSTRSLPETTGGRTLRIADGFLFVPMGERGLYVYDLSVPSQPRLTAEYDGIPVLDVAVADGRVYAVGPEGFAILALEELGGLRELSRIASASLRNVAYGQGMLFTLSGRSVIFFDVRDPERPEQTGAFDYFDEFEEIGSGFFTPRRRFFDSRSLAVWRNRLFVGTQDRGLMVFDLAAAPVFSGEVAELTGSGIGGGFYLVPELTGSLPMTYDWYHNGQLLTEVPNEPHLILPGIDASTAGIYELVATNPYGSASSGPIVFSLPPQEPPFTRLTNVNLNYLFGFPSAWGGSIFGVQEATTTEPYRMWRFGVDFFGGDVAPPSSFPFDATILGTEFYGGAVRDDTLYTVVKDSPGHEGIWMRTYMDSGEISEGVQREMPLYQPGSIAPVSARLAMTSDRSRLATLAMYPANGATGRGGQVEVFNLPSPGIDSSAASGSVTGHSLHDIAWVGNQHLVLSRSTDSGAHELVMLHVDGNGISPLSAITVPGPAEHLYVYGGERVIASFAGAVRGYLAVQTSGGDFVWSQEWERTYSSSLAPDFRPNPDNPNGLLGVSRTVAEHVLLDMGTPSSPNLIGPISVSGGWVQDRIPGFAASFKVYEADPLRGIGSRSPWTLVTHPPTISGDSATELPPPGGTFSLSVELSGDPSTVFLYEWLRDGVQVGTGYTGTFELSDIGIEDIGSYSVRITGVDGVAERELGEIDPRPFFGIPLNPVEVDEFDTFTAVWGAGTGAVFSELDTLPPGLILDADGSVSWTPGEEDGGETWAALIEADLNGRSFVLPVTFTAIEVNHPPVSNRGPVPPAIRNRLWRYPLLATDSDLPVQTLLYEMLEGPADMDVSSSGVVAWQVPLNEPLGPVAVRVSISDGVDAIEEEFDVTVSEGNTPPRWTNRPVRLSVQQGQLLSYTFTATDDEQDDSSLVFSLVATPMGLSFSSAGELSWIPNAFDHPAGVYELVLRVTDGIEPNEIRVPVTVLPGENSFSHVFNNQLVQHFDAAPDLAPPSSVESLRRFAHGQDVNGPDATRHLEIAVDRLNGETRIGFTYRQRAGGVGTPGIDYVADGVRYRVEVSTDLIQWFWGPQHVELVGSPLPNGDGTETVHVRARQRVTGETPAFIMLRLTSEP